MSRLPKTKSRPIVVGHAKYRWMVKDAKWRYGGSAKTMRLVIQQDADKPGDPLLASLTSKNWSKGNEEDWDFVHRAALKPSDVVKVIEAGLGQGWKPEVHVGRPFMLSGPLDLSDYALASPPPPPKTWYDFLLSD